MNQKFLHVTIPPADSPLVFGQHMDGRLSNCLKKHKDSVILDLGRISKLDSSYVGVLTRWHRNLKSVGGSLVIVGVDGDKLPVLQQAQLDALCEIHPHLDAFKEKHPGVKIKAETEGESAPSKSEDKPKKRTTSRTTAKTRKKPGAQSRKSGTAKPDPVALKNEEQAPSESPQPGFEVEASGEPETGFEVEASEEQAPLESGQSGFELESPEEPETGLEAIAPETDLEGVARSSEKPEVHLETDLEAVALEATRALKGENATQDEAKAPGIKESRETEWKHDPFDVSEQLDFLSDESGRRATGEKASRKISSGSISSGSKAPAVDAVPETREQTVAEELEAGELDAYAVGTTVQHSGEYQCLSCGDAGFFLNPYAFHPCTHKDCEDPGTGWHLVFKLF